MTQWKKKILNEKKSITIHVKGLDSPNCNRSETVKSWSSSLFSGEASCCWIPDTLLRRASPVPLRLCWYCFGKLRINGWQGAAALGVRDQIIKNLNSLGQLLLPLTWGSLMREAQRMERNERKWKLRVKGSGAGGEEICGVSAPPSEKVMTVHKVMQIRFLKKILCFVSLLAFSPHLDSNPEPLLLFHHDNDENSAVKERTGL